MRPSLGICLGICLLNIGYAQQPGDLMQAIRETEVSADGNHVATIPLGGMATVEKIENDLLWCWTPDGVGWVARKDLRTCKEAEAVWRKMIAKGNTNAYFNLAMAHDGIGDFKQAIVDLDDYLRFQPKTADVLSSRGFIWIKLGQPDKAEQDFSQSLRLAPSATAYLNRANLWLILGKGESAIEDCDEALKLDPESTYALVNRANAQRMLGHFDEAIEDYEHALRIDDASYATFRNYALLRAASPESKHRNGEQAVELAKKACDASGYKDSLSLSSLAIAYAESGDWESAIKWQETAIKHEKLEKNQPEHKRRLDLFKSQQPFRLKIGDPVLDD